MAETGCRPYTLMYALLIYHALAAILCFTVHADMLSRLLLLGQICPASSCCLQPCHYDCIGSMVMVMYDGHSHMGAGVLQPVWGADDETAGDWAGFPIVDAIGHRALHAHACLQRVQQV